MNWGLNGKSGALEVRREMGDSQGGSSVGSGKNTVVGDLQR